MNSQLSNWLRMCLPAILVVSVYMAFVSRGGVMREARQRRDALMATSPSPDVVAAEAARVRQIDTRLTNLKTETAALETAWSKLGSQVAPAPAARAKSLRQFSQLLWTNGLYEVERSPADNSDAHMPRSLDDMVKNIAGNTGTSSAKLWSIKFYGRYQNVVKLLEALRTDRAATLPMVVPVGLTMSETKEDAEDWRVWTLLLWM